MRHDSLGFLSAMVRTYGDIVVLPFGPVRVYLLCHPEQVAYVLQGHAPNYGKSRFSAQVRPLLGQGLATSDGALWRTQRRLVQPVFHRERLAALAATITTATQAMLARWASHAAAGTVLDMLAEMTRLTGEVIVRALFGRKRNKLMCSSCFCDRLPHQKSEGGSLYGGVHITRHRRESRCQ